MKVKLAKADAEFAKLVKDRDEWTCRKCGRTKGQGYVIHCAHVFTRRARSTRWDPTNAYSLCFLCHRWAHEWPTEFHAWAIAEMGVKVYAALAKRARTPLKVRETRKRVTPA